MKRTSVLLTVAALLTFSLTANAQNTSIRQTSNTNENQPYKIQYNNLKFGKSDYSKIVLNAWHAYDNNRLDDITMILADTVKAYLPDGSMINGKRAFLEGFKAYRSSFASVNSMVDACTTLKSDNVPNQDVTLIWGMETATKKDGTVQKASLHEIWFFNKDGMVTQFVQYSTPILDKK